MCLPDPEIELRPLFGFLEGELEGFDNVFNLLNARLRFFRFYLAHLFCRGLRCADRWVFSFSILSANRLEPALSRILYRAYSVGCDYLTSVYLL